MNKEQKIDKNSWNFHLAKSTAGLCDVTLEIHTEFWLCTLQSWFYGYQTPEGYEATIWGKKVDLHIAIAPLGTPTGTLPVIKEKTTRSKNHLNGIGIRHQGQSLSETFSIRRRAIFFFAVLPVSSRKILSKASSPHRMAFCVVPRMESFFADISSI